MKELIKEIRSCLANNNLRCALGMALTLPDICAKVEYPEEEETGKRYTKWCDEFLFNQGCLPTHVFENSIPSGQWQRIRVISSDLCYKLRCAFLHSGNLQLNQKKKDDYPVFELQISSSQENGVYTGRELRDKDNNLKEIRIDVRHLTKVLCNAAEEYYENCPQKEELCIHHVNIIDIEKEVEIYHEYKLLKDRQRAKRNAEDYEELSESAKNVLDLLVNGQGQTVRERVDKGDLDYQIAVSELIYGGFIELPPNEELFKK